MIDVAYTSASWYAADKETNYSNADTTLTWTDWGVNGRTLYKAGGEANAPRYKTNALNGHSTFEFSASSHMSASQDQTDVFFRQNYQTVFIVFKESNPSANWWEKSLMSCDEGGGNIDKWIFSMENTGKMVWECHYSPSNTDSELKSTATPYFTASTWGMGEFTKSGSFVNGYINGHNVIVNRSVTYPVSITAPFRVGFGEATATNTFTGEIAEILFYNGLLSLNDRQKIEGYLMWKYGLQSLLSGSHPYYNSPPTSSRFA